jgi:hypothetical protein
MNAYRSCNVHRSAGITRAGTVKRVKVSARRFEADGLASDDDNDSRYEVRDRAS